MSQFYNPYLGGDEIFNIDKMFEGRDSTGAPVNQAIQNLWERTGKGILAYGKSTTQFQGMGLEMDTTYGSDDAAKVFGQKSDKMNSILGGLAADSNVSGTESEVRAAVNRRIQTRRKAIRQADAISDYNVRTGNVYGDYRDATTGRRRSIYDQLSDQEIADFTEENMARFASFDELLPDMKYNAFQRTLSGRMMSARLGKEVGMDEAMELSNARMLEAFGSQEEMDRFLSGSDQRRVSSLMNMDRDAQSTERAREMVNAYNEYNYLNDMFTDEPGNRRQINIRGASGSALYFERGGEVQSSGELERQILAALGGEDSLANYRGGSYDPKALLQQFGEFYEEQRTGASEVSATSIRAELEQRRADLMKAQENMERQERESATKLREGQEDAEYMSKQLKAENQRDIDNLNRMAADGPEFYSKKKKVRAIDMTAGRPQ